MVWDFSCIFAYDQLLRQNTRKLAAAQVTEKVQQGALKGALEFIHSATAAYSKGWSTIPPQQVSHPGATVSEVKNCAGKWGTPEGKPTKAFTNKLKAGANTVELIALSASGWTAKITGVPPREHGRGDVTDAGVGTCTAMAAPCRQPMCCHML